ncbi:hypothetical protein COL154_003944 [Colletotrichum chrysophilum]|uniref:Uncharacterized protein n=1 Tax=Colletotrichum chrysophilum TaxID=1836956 RepID=A0AAD9EBD9_9PEZI|nr:uncharacterized protein COL26b_003275 [Colletotrichum chrysophilum]KAJ0350332.1 hypothetical protein KNSL1_004004 [Colletotrichum chrysophilum]KAJ0366354.1 hypothetical protein COL154_003944 [Colletotrichum chrysophilum]KAJ0378391.1 hypothetical protein COL26b_003275 [Colletotrichum chrysophilum]KAK1842400.1 hypothetical protein CCHR01_14976 [Colletotrichum chrysophilum]
MDTLDQSSFSASMDEINQIEICRLQAEACHLSTENHDLAQLKEVDQEQIIKLQNENDRLKHSNATKDSFIMALIQEKQDLEEQNAQLRSERYLGDQRHTVNNSNFPHNSIMAQASTPTEPLSPSETLVNENDEDLDAMDIDEPAKGGDLSASDSGFEGYGSEGAWDMV